MSSSFFKNVSYKSIFLISVFLNISVSSLQASHFSGFSPLDLDDENSFDQSFQFPSLKEISPEDKLNSAISSLTKIQSIYDFDPNILVEGEAVNNLNLTHIDLSQAIAYLPFYSENKQVRDFAFESSIKKPLLTSLQEAAESSYKFPQTLKYLMEPQIFADSQGLIAVAIKDIFADPHEGIRALLEVLKSLQKNKKITLQEEKSLRLFKNLAGYFYDRKALSYLIEVCQSVSKLDMAQTKSRLALLRILQIEGEFFKLMMPSTLDLAATMPNEGLLEGLRDKLSHLNKQKFEKLLSLTSETTKTFEDVKNDFLTLKSSLEALQTEWETKTTHFSPNDLWAYLKGLPEARDTTKSSASSWAGLTSLLTLLDSHPSGSLPSLLFDAEISALCRLPANAQEVDEYFNRRKSLYNVLNEAKKDITQFKGKLVSVLGSPIEDQKCEAIFDQLKEAQKEISTLYSSGKKDDGNAKKKELSGTIDKILLELMGIDEKKHKELEDSKTEKREVERKQNELKRFLDQTTTKPCNGFGNLSDKYEEFCDKLTENGIVVTNSVFDWTKEPDSPLELLFHKVHRTGLDSKSAKDNLRKTRIASLLEIIDILRSSLNITTVLALETDKQTQKTIIEGKAKIIADSIRELNTSKPEKNQLWEIHKKFYDLGGKALRANNQKDIDDINEEAKQYIQEFLTTYKPLEKDPAIVSKLESDLNNKTRGQKLLGLRRFIAEQQAQKNPRFHLPKLVEQKLKESQQAQGDLMSRCEFLVSVFYELFKEVNDYPELRGLIDTDQVRNYFFHLNPFNSEPLIVESKGTFDAGIHINDPEGTITKEVSILAINVKDILEKFIRTV